ncbi:MAG: hypothetical protein ABI697_13475 [Devosia sp.]
MASEVERFIRIEAPHAGSGTGGRWRTLPNAARVLVWDMSIADALPTETDEAASPKRFIFHINYIDGVTRGCRVSYLGESFVVLGVSDSTRLRGLELRCAPSAPG